VMTMRGLAGVVAMLATSWLLYSYYDTFWYPPDEGNYAHVAQRILEGETLNLQVQDVHPGYISFLNAAALRVFGADLISLRYPLVLVSLLQALVLFMVFPRHDPWRAAVATVALVALGAIQFLNPTAHWHCLALVILLVATLGPAPRTSRQILAVGILIGTIALFRQLTGLLAGIGAFAFLLWAGGERGVRGPDALWGRGIATAMAAALACYLVLATDIGGFVLFGVWPLALLARLVFRPQAPNREVARIAGTAAAGIAIAALPLVGYHVWHGSLQAWADDVGPAAMALTKMDFIGRSNFGAIVFHGLRQVVTGRDAPTLLNGLYWAVLPLLAATNGLVVFRLLTRAQDNAVAALPVMAVFYAVVSVHFQIPVYLYYTAGLSLASLLWLAPRVSPFAARASIVVALVLSVTAVYFHAGQPASRSTMGVLRGERTPSARAPALPHNSLRIDLDEGRRYAALVEIIRREVPADEAILAVPSNAELYFLSQRRNGFRFYNTALGVRTDAELAAVEQSLRDHPPRLVTFNRDDKYNTSQSWQIMEVVRHRYVLLGRFEPFDVYVLP
jgi:hypothetical protein